MCVSLAEQTCTAKQWIGSRLTKKEFVLQFETLSFSIKWTTAAKRVKTEEVETRYTICNGKYTYNLHSPQ